MNADVTGATFVHPQKMTDDGTFPEEYDTEERIIATRVAK